MPILSNRDRGRNFARTIMGKPSIESEERTTEETRYQGEQAESQRRWEAEMELKQMAAQRMTPEQLAEVAKMLGLEPASLTGRGDIGYRTPRTVTDPTSYREWTLAGGKKGTEMSFANWVRRKDKEPEPTGIAALSDSDLRAIIQVNARAVEFEEKLPYRKEIVDAAQKELSKRMGVPLIPAPSPVSDIPPLSPNIGLDIERKPLPKEFDWRGFLEKVATGAREQLPFGYLGKGLDPEPRTEGPITPALPPAKPAVERIRATQQRLLGRTTAPKSERQQAIELLLGKGYTRAEAIKMLRGK